MRPRLTLVSEMLEGPHRYKLVCRQNDYGVTDEAGRSKFSGAAAQSGPKLHVVGQSGWPIYVGVTEQAMAARLRLGWQADGTTGYHGYQWRHDPAELGLDLWLLGADAVESPRQYLETIEAEIVFLIRQSGQWPKHQTEIHFHPSSDEQRREAARILSFYRNMVTPNDALQRPGAGREWNGRR